MSRRRFVRVEDLLGQRVRVGDEHDVGRIEEIRVERRGDTYEVTELLIGSGALLERLGLRPAVAKRASTLVARWDQIDLTSSGGPRLLCAPGELKHE